MHPRSRILAIVVALLWGITGGTELQAQTDTLSCWWGQVYPPPFLNDSGAYEYPAFPDGTLKKDCIFPTPEQAAECWRDAYSPDPLTPGGFSCYLIDTLSPQPYICGTGGYAPPDFQCQFTFPMQCLYTYPVLLPITGLNADENCAIFKPPIAVFIYRPQAPAIDEVVTFDASASSGQIFDYAWDFGDGNKVSTPNAIVGIFAHPLEKVE